jgi:uncharacterized protein YxjI
MLDRKVFLVKERVGFLKLTDTYDIFDPASGVQVGLAREAIHPALKVLRLVVNKRLLPTTIEVREGEEGPLVLSIKRGFSLLHARVSVRDANGAEIGRFRSKLLSIGGAFAVFDTAGNEVAEVKGDWKGWNFQFLDRRGSRLGTVTKKWAGVGQELFTSADNYVIALEGESQPRVVMALLLAAGLAVDMVFKEK